MTPDPAALRIVVANWRDGRHPGAGGAEVYAESLAAELAGAGHDVTFLSAAVRGAGRATAEAAADNVLHRNGGGRWTVYPWVAGWLLLHRSHVDVVIDCQNGVPFFAPLWVRRRTAVVCVVHHVHTDQFGLHFPRPVAALGRLLEGPVASRVYGDRPAVVVSPSTARGLRERLRWRGAIHVVPNGAPAPAPEAYDRKRNPTPTVVSVGRLVVHKRVKLLIAAVAQLVAAGTELRAQVIGDGPSLDDVRALVLDLDLSDVVSVSGRLGDGDVQSAVDSAWLTVATTRGEGWGLTVLEAAARGVPTVAFDVDGLRDSVRPGRTGWLVAEGGDLADGIRLALDELADPSAAQAMSRVCRAWAAEFSWPASAQRLAAVVAGEVDRRRDPGPPARRRGMVDDSSLAEMVGPTVQELAAAAARLRRTDRFGVWESRSWLLLGGCRPADVAAALLRAGLDPSFARTTLAGPEEVLRTVPLRGQQVRP